jgi:LysR family hydrogen peroxide-inducible transcriptional activator
MSRFRDADALRLTIGAVPALPPRLLPTLLARVRDELPELAVSMRTLPADARLPEALDSAGGVNIALLRKAKRTTGIVTRLVASDPIGLALPAAHELSTLPAVPPPEISGRPLVTFPPEADPEMHRKLFGSLAAAGFTGPGALYESASGAVDASLRLVANGTAVSFKLASEVEAFDDPTIVWRPILGLNITVFTYAAWRREVVHGPLRHVLPLLPQLGRSPQPTDG